MKSGFHTDFPLEKEQEVVQRADQNIPLNKFGIAGLDWENIKKKLELPDQYLRTCTLREGTITTMCIYQTMSLTVVVFLMVLVVIFPERTEYWWKEKFRNDLDFYYQDENVEMINTLYPLWRPFTYAVIAVHAIFFLTGWMVIFALVKKDVHPCWYMPWILVSSFLSTVHWLVCGCLIIAMFIFAFYREVSVTWDMVPICLAIAYGIGWTYSCAVVIAHYKRRCIVRYWRDRQHLIGSETHPPEIAEYLYQYGNKSR